MQIQLITIIRFPPLILKIGLNSNLGHYIIIICNSFSSNGYILFIITYSPAIAGGAMVNCYLLIYQNLYKFVILYL